MDDDSDYRESMRRLLWTVNESFPVRVLEASAGAQAKEILLREHVDCVLLDQRMPGGDGIDWIAEFLKVDSYLPIVMVTGQGDEATAVSAMKQGAMDYLVKGSISAEALQCVVTNAARVKALDDERRREQRAKERYQQDLQAAVTSLTAANDQLRKAATFREEVEQVTRHDLKAPLSIILGAPDLIRMMGGSLTEKQLSYLEKIENAGRRLLDMINRSLDLFKIEQGMYALHPQAVDLLSVAQEVISHNEALMRVKRLSVVILIDDHPAAKTDEFVVPGERLLCYSMLGNLLKNAMEASPPGASVTLQFERVEATRVSIRNRGAVPEAIRARFFEKFSTAGKDHGTGLGTYSARLIAEIHHARITVDTSAPDFTTVTVCFPVHPDDFITAT